MKKILEKIKAKITSVGNWLISNQNQILMIGIVIMFIVILALVISLLAAFWLMGLPGSKWNFPLQIGVSAVGGIVTGLATIVGLIKKKEAEEKAELHKYEVDSTYNSISGQMPEKRE